MTRALLCLVLLQSALVLALRWGHPLASHHAFRETQTAMTTYWMLHGGPLVAYQTPVMGPPWQIMYEFPTFQWIVAGVVYVTGISLDNGGRLVSWVFLFACLWPLRRMAFRHGVDPDIGSALMLASPLYLFWGTAFLIETCSVFLCLMFLWMVEEERWMVAIAFGTLAAVTKMTTIMPFLCLAVLMGKSLRCSFIITAIALCAGVTWTHITDLLKSQNPLSAVLMTSVPAQMLHNFGTLAQRFSLEPWRTLCDSIGGLL